MHVKIVGTFHFIGKGFFLLTKVSFSADHIGKDGVSSLGGVRKLRLRRNRDIEIFRVNDDVANRPAVSGNVSADDLDPRAVAQNHLRGLRAFHIPISGIHHFVGRGQVGPKLKTAHEALRVAFRHFLVDDSVPRGHPLNIARRDDAFVSHAVAVFHLSAKDVGNGLDSAMGMPRESFEIVRRILRAKIIQKQEGIKEGDLTVPEGAFEVNTGTFYGRLAFESFLNGPGLLHFSPP